ncbi:hypothetical protein GCM10014713_65220 [Streptomyces purpureus]|uniref:Uncharacterized protein n=1 Tax=Streptomyces purpureus TaxID=1951 RepID=A0A918HGD7_9ACTN|nr:hypothetical protein GCM10014713_65220 [Streptomyces purpureus]
MDLHIGRLCRCAQKLTSTAQCGAQTPLGRPAVETYVERAGKRALGSQARGQPGGVETVTPGDEDAELVTAQSVGPGRW